MNLDFSKFLHDKRILLVAALVLLFLIISAIAVSYFVNREPYVAVPPTAEYVPNELIIRYREGKAPHELSETERADLEERLLGIGITSQEKLFEAEDGLLSRSYLLYFEESVELIDLQEKLSEFPEIAISEPSFLMEPFAVPSDPMYGQLWGMQKINAPTAWDATTGSSSIVVAVVDSGVDASHPDLSSRLMSGFNALNGGSNSLDENGHGTHVSGTIGAIGNNGVGVVGVNWDVRILPVKVFGSSGSSSSSTIVQGIEWAINNGAKVVNLSLGNPQGNVPCVRGTVYDVVISDALSKGIVVVAAAGNEARNAGEVSPASCEGVITVGATDQSDRRSIWSSTGASNYGAVVDIGAPGTGIVSSVPGGYKSNNGTSMAAPHVAGAAALLLSANTNLSVQQVRDCLVNNADSISTDRPIGPRLNIANAISACANIGGVNPTATPVISTPTPGLNTPTPARFYISGRVFEDRNGNNSYDSGEGIPNATLSLSGSFADTATTLTDGTYIFDNLFAGTFNVSYDSSVRSGINLTQSSPAVNLNFIVTRDVANPTPTIIAGPTSIPVIPTATPQPTSAVTITPTPTPATYYTCDYDPSCTSGQKNIQLCPLICTEI